MNEDGYHWYVSRADDMIVSSGYNIAAPEVEDALLTHDAVPEAAVTGAPDEERGQIVKAFVVLKPGVEPGAQTVRALQDHVKQTIAPYKIPAPSSSSRSCPRRKRANCSVSSCASRHFPAMAVVEVKTLIEDGALIEIETTAVVP